ncbi:MAG: hypothetical protein ACE5GH_06120, partial [Fidelibacterota bacterium]
RRASATMREARITPFEGNLYIRRKYLSTAGFRPNYLVGFCSYKFLYVWLDLKLDNGVKFKKLGWLYWVPNPLFPFIWYRIGLPRNHPDLLVEEYEEPVAVTDSHLEV